MNIYIETYGCTANKSDERVAISILKQNAHTIVETIDDADVLVILTCTVIGTTEQRMLSRLRVFKKTQKPVIVAGCMPVVQSDLVKSIIPNAKLLTPQQISYIHHCIDNQTIPDQPWYKDNCSKEYDGITAPIAIAHGCLYSCSYCITHYARGMLHSLGKKDIITDVTQAVKQGCKEIYLTAQDTASYGMDREDDLGNLLNELCQIKGTFRIRVGMMNPFTLKNNLTSIVKSYQHSKIYTFLHLPVQSGDNTILKKMNRKYTVEEFKTILTTFRQTFPHLMLSTDMIIGFPGETEEQFNHSLELLKDIKSDIVNITRFSPRPLTKAKTMKQKVPTQIVKDRSRKMTVLSKTIAQEINRSHIGTTYSVLITNKTDEVCMGRAENYKPVIIHEQINRGDIVPVKIIDTDSIHLVGKLI